MVENARLIPNTLLTQAGVLPLKSGPVRFAVGSPNGVTSNSWRIWTTSAGDVYIACRDNFKEFKVSLHVSGRWRMGFTSEALEKNNKLLLGCNQNRAWEVWDRPPHSLPETVVAFRLIFPTSELAVHPEQRIASQWSDVVFIEAAPAGKLTILTLFITNGSIQLKRESEPSFILASLEIGAGRFAQLVAHGDPAGMLPDLIDQCVINTRQQAQADGIDVPVDAYGYFFGQQGDGSRFLVGARFARDGLNAG